MDMDMDMDMGNGTTTTCPMIMVFHAGHCERILWSWWVASGVGEFIASCIALGVIAFAMEAVKYWREVLMKKEAKRLRQQYAIKNNEGSHGSGSGNDSHRLTTNMPEQSYCQRITRTAHLVQVLLYGLQMIISYLIMLAFMNFNYWMCLSMIIGLALGYFFFGWIKQDAYDTGDCCS